MSTHQTTSGLHGWACTCGESEHNLTATESHERGARHFKTAALNPWMRRHTNPASATAGNQTEES